MEDSNEIEVQPYEEMVGSAAFSSPFSSRSVSPVNDEETLTDSPPPQEPSQEFGSYLNAGTTNPSCHTQRSDLRIPVELAGNQHEPRRVVAATMAPNVWGSSAATDVAVSVDKFRNQSVRQQDLAADSNVRPVSVPVMIQKDLTSHSSSDDRPRSAPVSWMAAVTTRLNMLWDAFYQRPTKPVSVLSVTDREPTEDRRRDVSSATVQADRGQPSRPTAQSERRLWRLDSDIEIDVDRLPVQMPNPELDLSVPQRSVRIRTDAETVPTEAPRRSPIARDRASEKPNPDRRSDVGRSASEKTMFRQTAKRTSSRRPLRSPSSRRGSVSRDRRSVRSRNGRDRSSDSQSLPCSQNRPRRHSAQRTQSNRTLPNDDDGDGDSSDSDHRNSDRGRRRRRDRPRRRRERSPNDDDSDENDDGDGTSGRSSSETEVPTVRDRKQMRIKLQKFDGTGSWESWWAHFRNCASYNRWTERDKLAFLKGALTGNAAQVLWDTDRSTTGSLKKLVAVLKSRYSGERQAEKHRAELQIRRRRPHESLSELHQDIRRLTVLAYPKLTAEAREQIGCDHFTNALSDPEFALKVKERAPKTLDEALCVALRLEAWAKSVRQDRQEDDRLERQRQKIRATGKSETAKATCRPESDDRLAKIEAEVSQLNEKLKSLKEIPQFPIRPTDSAENSSAVITSQRPENRSTASAGETPSLQNARNSGNEQPIMWQTSSRQSQPVLCWNCGLPGHIRRNCTLRNQSLLGPPPTTNTVNRGSSKMQDTANVYLKMSLLGKDEPCLVDTGCELTLVPQDLVSQCAVSYTHLTLPTILRV